MPNEAPPNQWWVGNRPAYGDFNEPLNDPVAEPEPEVQQKPKRVTYTIESVKIKSGVARITAHRDDNGDVCSISMVPQYNTYHLTRTDANSIVRAVGARLAAEGVPVTEQGRTSQPELIEEMYQFINVLLENDGLLEKYFEQWRPIREQFYAEMQ